MKLFKKEYNGKVYYNETDITVWRSLADAVTQYKLASSAHYIVNIDPPRIDYPSDILGDMEFSNFDEIIDYIDGIIAFGEL